MVDYQQMRKFQFNISWGVLQKIGFYPTLMDILAFSHEKIIFSPRKGGIMKFHLEL